MPVTLGDLLADRELGLSVAVAGRGLDRPVSWVHSSELADPTPYLDGGELLLTTGLALTGTAPEDYAARLAAHRLAGLGFGTDLGYARVPAALVRSCTAHGLPLLVVPERTPFLAIAKAVSAALAAESYAQVVRTDQAQRSLTAAALGRGGAGGVVRRLAELLDGWAAVVDAGDTVRVCAPRTAARRLSGLRSELARVRGRHGATSATVADGADHVVLHRLRLPGPGVLAVGRPAPFSPVDLQVVGAAVSVLTLLQARTTAVGRAERALRTAVLRAMVELPGPGVAAIGEPLWGRPPGEGALVLALRGRSGSADELLDALEALDDGPLFFAELDGAVVVVAEPELEADVLAATARVPDVRAGVSEPVRGAGDHPPGGAHNGLPVAGPLHTAVEQASRALDAARRLGRARVRFADLAGSGLHELVPGRDAAAFAEALLHPLVRHDARGRGDLVASLREWLAHHGQWDPAAAALGVHRHTLRARIDKAAELLGRDLDSPGVRAELWFALHVPARP
ncbi:PucR family transcriptional regulator [Pseudonocardia yuanmonensis]|uniref:PucR family transcriptional regulator n=1 Tax=Pseudonocardia yuanmonensis TaxID=1095914 RepID=A0ABP8X4Q3_9PSEU